MGKSVKIKDLLKPALFHQISGDESALEREVFCARNESTRI